MTKAQIIKHYGSQAAAARAIGLRAPSIAGWVRVPPLQQLRIEQLTGGILRAGRECDAYRVGHAR